MKRAKGAEWRPSSLSISFYILYFNARCMKKSCSTPACYSQHPWRVGSNHVHTSQYGMRICYVRTSTRTSVCPLQRFIPRSYEVENIVPPPPTRTFVNYMYYHEGPTTNEATGRPCYKLVIFSTNIEEQNGRDLRFSRRRTWISLCSGLLHRCFGVMTDAAIPSATSAVSFQTTRCTLTAASHFRTTLLPLGPLSLGPPPPPHTHTSSHGLTASAGAGHVTSRAASVCGPLIMYTSGAVVLCCAAPVSQPSAREPTYTRKHKRARVTDNPVYHRWTPTSKRGAKIALLNFVEQCRS
jgi:hypothetical protein